MQRCAGVTHPAAGIESALMKKKYLYAIPLAIIFVASHSIYSIAAEKPPDISAIENNVNPIIRQMIDYALPELGNYPEKRAIQTDGKGTASLGASSFSATPGVIIGNTYYDIQHINTTGRMVGVGYNIAGADTGANK